MKRRCIVIVPVRRTTARRRTGAKRRIPVRTRIGWHWRSTRAGQGGSTVPIEPDGRRAAAPDGPSRPRNPVKYSCCRNGGLRAECRRSAVQVGGLTVRSGDSTRAAAAGRRGRTGGSNMDVSGHAALVTGGGSGLGAETARHLARAGARVAVLDVNREGAREVAAETGGLALHCDVADAASGEAAVAAAREAHGPARVLVNCAGVGTPGRIVSRTGPLPLEDYVRVINVNLVGTFNLMRLAAAGMTGLDPVNDSGERGVIVNTASVAAFDGQVGAGGLWLLQGGRRGADPAGGARAGPVRGAGAHHRPGPGRDPDAPLASARRPEEPRRFRAVSPPGSPARTNSPGWRCTSSTTRF